VRSRPPAGYLANQPLHQVRIWLARSGKSGKWTTHS